MLVLSRCICAMVGGLLIGFPGLLLAEEGCILTGDAELSSYVNQLADGIGQKAAINYGQGDRETPENAFTRGAIGVRAADVFVTVQFNRGGSVTDFDVQRLSARPVDEVLVHLLDECLAPYAEDLGVLAEPIGKQVQFQLGEEEIRKAKMGL